MAFLGFHDVTFTLRLVCDLRASLHPTKIVGIFPGGERTNQRESEELWNKDQFFYRIQNGKAHSYAYLSAANSAHSCKVCC